MTLGTRVFLWVCVSLSIFSCQEDQDFALNTEYFLGDWQVIDEHWAIGINGIDSLLFVDTFNIEFYSDGTCLKQHQSVEFQLDWFYRDSPKQLFLTEVGELWPVEVLYDISKMERNYQEWEYGTDIGFYYDYHSLMAQRR